MSEEIFTKIVSYADGLREDKIEPIRVYNSELRNKAHTLFVYLTKLFNYDKAPKILTKKEYNKVNCFPFFRGVKSSDHGAGFLLDKDYYRGTGTYCSGAYFTKDESVALGFAALNPTNVIEFKLPVPKIMGDTELKAYLQTPEEFLDDDAPKPLREFIKLLDEMPDHKAADYLRELMFYDIASLGVIAGQDAVYIEGSGNYFALLNRGKIIVDESRLDEMREESENYRREERDDR